MSSPVLLGLSSAPPFATPESSSRRAALTGTREGLLSLAPHGATACARPGPTYSQPCEPFKYSSCERLRSSATIEAAAWACRGRRASVQCLRRVSPKAS